MKSFVATLVFLFLFAFVNFSFADDVSFEGISLGNKASQLIKKYGIDPSKANATSSDDSCELANAKSLISCVWHVATCKPFGYDSCPKKDFCANEDQINIRQQEYESCKDEEKQIAKLKKWGAGVTHLIASRQVVCRTEEVYRRVINAYIDGIEGPLRNQLGFDCRIIKNPVPAKVIGESKDGKLFQIEYRIPYSNYISDGWLAKGSLMTEDERKRSRF